MKKVGEQLHPNIVANGKDHNKYMQHLIPNRHISHSTHNVLDLFIFISIS
jgi:hypothetical protein